jgi:hypothetical protein
VDAAGSRGTPLFDSRYDLAVRLVQHVPQRAGDDVPQAAEDEDEEALVQLAQVCDRACQRGCVGAVRARDGREQRRVEQRRRAGQVADARGGGVGADEVADEDAAAVEHALDAVRDGHALLVRQHLEPGDVRVVLVGQEHGQRARARDEQRRGALRRGALVEHVEVGDAVQAIMSKCQVSSWIAWSLGTEGGRGTWRGARNGADGKAARLVVVLHAIWMNRFDGRRHARSSARVRGSPPPSMISAVPSITSPCTAACETFSRRCVNAARFIMCFGV